MKPAWLGPATALVLLFHTNAALDGATAAPVEFVRVPGHGIQPETVVDDSGVLHLLYFAGEPRGGDLFYVRSKDDGRTFTTPIRVNSQPGSAIAAGTIRGGQIAVGRNGRVHVAWNGSDAAEPKGLINPDSHAPSAPFLYARSNAEGTGFEPQRNLTTRSYGIDGGGSIAADSRGHVYATWQSLPVGSSSGEDHRRVWIARSADDGATFAAEEPAWGEQTGACGCCGMRMLAGPSDNLYLLYRSATAMTHRDIFLLESSDMARTFRGSRVQTWRISACPMTSMSIAASTSGVLGAWETAGQVYFGNIDTKTARIPAPIAAPGAAGGRKHPRLATGTGGNVLFVWTEGTAWSRGGSLAWQVFDSAGHPTAVKGLRPGIPVWSFAAAFTARDGRFVILY
jgi:hypothetical protein